jgi:TonB family protein
VIRKFTVRVIYALLLILALSVSAAAQDRAVTKQVRPTYPEMARRMHVAGTVVLKVTIGTDGKVKSATPVSGHPLLTQAALTAVKEWVYTPGPEETRNVELKFEAQ